MKWIYRLIKRSEKPKKSVRLRDEHLHRYTEASRRLYGQNTVRSHKKLVRLNRIVEQAEERYFESLPAEAISRCPFCNSPLEVRADFFGWDGLFWDPLAEDAFIATCAHFLTYLGAVALDGRVPSLQETGPWNEIYIGPEVPFVIPRIMELGDVKCVIHSRDIIKGAYRAYFMAYFIETPVTPSDGHPCWLRTEYGWRDPWDFELAPWLARKQIFWISPNDILLKLRQGPEFPYANLSGKRHQVIIGKGRLREVTPPDGSAPDLLD